MSAQVIHGDCLEVLRQLESESVQTCVTSPPYYALRQYLPNGVRIREDLAPEELDYLLKELARLGIVPITGEV